MKFVIAPKSASVPVFSIYGGSSGSSYPAWPKPIPQVFSLSFSQTLNCLFPAPTYFLSNLIFLFYMLYILSMLIFKNISWICYFSMGNMLFPHGHSSSSSCHNSYLDLSQHALNYSLASPQYNQRNLS